MFDKNKIEKLRNLKTTRITGKVISKLGNEILEAIENGNELKVIAEKLEQEIGKKISYNYLKQWAWRSRKTNYEETKNKEEKGKCKMKKNVILVANDKGGVGKTTISSLLNLPRQVIINLDSTRKIAEIYPYKEVIDFAEYSKRYGIDSIEEYLDNIIYSDRDKHENIILDTKGGASNEILNDAGNIISYLTHIIVPIKLGDLSEQPSYEFILNLKTLADQYEKKLSWAIVFNEVSPKYLKRNMLKYELGDRLQETVKQIRDYILHDDLKVATFLRKSEAITTREYKKVDIDDLFTENPAAYLPIINEIDRFNKDIQKML